MIRAENDPRSAYYHATSARSGQDSSRSDLQQFCLVDMFLLQMMVKQGQIVAMIHFNPKQIPVCLINRVMNNFCLNAMQSLNLNTSWSYLYLASEQLVLEYVGVHNLFLYLF